jgi:hypothetical protein
VSISTSPDVRCPRCSAHVRAGSDWCTLCYADLRPAPLEPVAPEPTPQPEPAEAVLEQGVPADQPPAGRGKHARKESAYDGGDVAAADPATARANALADQLLAELAASEAKNPLGALAGAVDSKGKRMALILGATGTAICLILLLMAGIGLLL